MGRRVRLLSAMLAGTLAFVVGASTANAILSGNQYKCQTTIAKEGGKYAGGLIKLHQKCITANLKTPGSCAAIDPGSLIKLQTKLDAGLLKSCNLSTLDFSDMGFPGACVDANPNDGFTLADLQSCIRTSHEGIVGGTCTGGSNQSEACAVVADCPDSGPGTACEGLMQLEYDATVRSGPLTGTALNCQKAIASAAGKVATTTIKAVQKCRNDLLNCKTDPNTLITTCKLSGLIPENCATADAKTQTTIQKAKDKAVASIVKKCTDADVIAIKACEPDQITKETAANCEADAHKLLMDNPSVTTFDLLDYEYTKEHVCGDNRLNQNSEECDGGDAPACPGACGPASGFFACLCTDTPRQRVVEHGNADLDNGWSGISHDSGIVEGGGYVSDLWDCDGPGGPITLCNVGPTCNLPPHQSCSPAPANTVNADTLCPGVGNFCRMTLGGVQGKHCAIDFKKRCKQNTDCPGALDSCVTTLHGAPLPLSSGGVAVCVVNEFTEDIVGTTDFADGSSAVRLRQDSKTFQGGSQSQPCPVCGGFCSGPGSEDSPNVRNLCSSDADCTAPATCILDNVCSFGLDMDKPCNPNPPVGGPTEFFGNPSKDCHFSAGILGTIDILFNPATTNAVSLTANQLCNRAGFNNKRCVAGSNEFAVCTVDSECPGGTCNNQCFCSIPISDSQAPNGCQSACRGGLDDAQPCTDDIDCSAPGFCHPGDCRVNLLDTDSAQEGQCTVGPSDGTCSTHPFKTCVANSGCSNIPQCVGGANDDAPCTTASQCPGGTCTTATCPFCDDNETCAFNTRQCFVSPTIQRIGSPGIPDKTTATIFCIAKTSSAAVNNVAGLPGPGAITQPTTTIDVGF